RWGQSRFKRVRFRRVDARGRIVNFPTGRRGLGVAQDTPPGQSLAAAVVRNANAAGKGATPAATASRGRMTLSILACCAVSDGYRSASPADRSITKPA